MFVLTWLFIWAGLVESRNNCLCFTSCIKNLTMYVNTEDTRNITFQHIKLNWMYWYHCSWNDETIPKTIHLVMILLMAWLLLLRKIEYKSKFVVNYASGDLSILNKYILKEYLLCVPYTILKYMCHEHSTHIYKLYRHYEQ